MHSAIKRDVDRALLDFAWNEWGQMGVLAAPARRSSWAQDPEALLVFTLEVARLDPRLFDETLDWLLLNEHLISVRRLRSACSGDEDRLLVDATLAWLAEHRPQARLGGKSRAQPVRTPVHLFRGLPQVTRDLDPVFERYGLLRPMTLPTGKSQHPDLRAPINFAFRMRQLLGVGARSEVVRFLLTNDAPSATAQVVARSAGFAKRNVHEALVALSSAGVVSAIAAGGEQRYAIDRERWATLLAIDRAALPGHRDWPQLLRAFTGVLRWLHRPELADLSPYLLASETRDVLERVRADLEYSGIQVGASRTAADAMTDLSGVIDQALATVLAR